MTPQECKTAYSGTKRGGSFYHIADISLYRHLIQNIQVGNLKTVRLALDNLKRKCIVSQKPEAYLQGENICDHFGEKVSFKCYFLTIMLKDKASEQLSVAIQC